MATTAPSQPHTAQAPGPGPQPLHTQLQEHGWEESHSQPLSRAQLLDQQEQPTAVSSQACSSPQYREVVAEASARAGMSAHNPGAPPLTALCPHYMKDVSQQDLLPPHARSLQGASQGTCPLPTQTEPCGVKCLHLHAWRQGGQHWELLTAAEQRQPLKACLDRRHAGPISLGNGYCPKVLGHRLPGKQSQGHAAHLQQDSFRSLPSSLGHPGEAQHPAAKAQGQAVPEARPLVKAAVQLAPAYRGSPAFPSCMLVHCRAALGFHLLFMPLKKLASYKEICESLTLIPHFLLATGAGLKAASTQAWGPAGGLC